MTWISQNLLAVALLSVSLVPGAGSKAPAGTAQVAGLRYTFLDKSELTNADWKTYINDVKKASGEDSEAYKNTLPDTAVWKQSYRGPYIKSQRYDDWPVIGVSYDQAMDYCVWRSKTISQKERREVTYSLPSLKVLKMASRDSSPNKIAEGLYSTSIGFRTFLGLCENADEMTDVEGIAILGSDRITCMDTITYDVPTASLSFRCMAVLQ